MISAKIENLHSSGNTTSLANGVEDENSKIYRKKVQNVILTVNEKSIPNTSEIIAYLQHWKSCQYILMTSHDKPQFHYHIFAQYNNPVVVCSDKLYGAHFEKCLGSAQQNVNYLMGNDAKHQALGIKCEQVYEWGTMKNRGGRRIGDLKKMTNDEIEQLDGSLYMCAKRIKEDLERDQMVNDWLEVHNIEVEWIFGAPGSGKTYYSKMIGRKLINEGKSVLIIFFDKNGFVHYLGNREAELIIINEFRDYNLDFTAFLEILTNEHMYNIKQSDFFTPKVNKIIITSQQNPLEIYRNQAEDRNQIYRRITKIWRFERINDSYKRTKLTINKDMNMFGPTSINDIEDITNLKVEECLTRTPKILDDTNTISEDHDDLSYSRSVEPFQPIHESSMNETENSSEGFPELELDYMSSNE